MHPPPTNSKATASLVLGILSFVAFPLVAAVAAIVLGHMARGEIKTNPYQQGGGSAVAGLVLGYVNLVGSLLTIGFVVLFMFGAAVAVQSQLSDAMNDTAQLQVRELTNALELYKIKTGQFPSTDEGLEVLANPEGSRRPIMDLIPTDPWNQEYEYRSPGVHHPNRFDLWSRGPDGVTATDDDITNW